ncbi:ribonuclease H-like domain-containing protein [Tanacetum coccineum]
MSTIKLLILKKAELNGVLGRVSGFHAGTRQGTAMTSGRESDDLHPSGDKHRRDEESLLGGPALNVELIAVLMIFTKDHLAKFHKMIDAKEMWDAIKSRFSGVSTEDANQKFLRSFPSSWAHISLALLDHLLVHRMSPLFLLKALAVLMMLVLLMVFPTSPGYNSTRENSSSYTDELMYSLFANQSSGLHLDHEDLEQLDKRLQFDSYEPVGFDKTKVECYNCHNTRHFSRECKSKGNQDSRRRDAGNTRYRAKDNGRTPGKQEEPKALVTLGGEGVDWTGHAEDEQDNFT